MTYIVRWSSAAIAELQRLEQAATDGESFRQSSAWVDYSLRRIAGDLGESHDNGERLWFSDVLSVFFRVDDTTMSVLVIAIAPARRRRG